jgi:peptidoglycan/LPS O-acetylase OafA/YrhL
MPSAINSSDRDIPLSYRPDIDGLRALAVIAVVITHAFPRFIRGGFIGVDIFFVISGYLISSIIFRGLNKGRFSFTEFYAHRIKRIFPALAVVLIASFTFGWFALLPDEYTQLGKHMAASAGFVQNFVLWKEAGYFDVASELKPLLHLWSLAVEEQFYLVYPLLIWMVWRWRQNAVIFLLLLLALVSFGLNIHGVHKDLVGAYYLPQTRFWELMAGCILAYWQSARPLQIQDRARPRHWVSIGGFLLIIVAMFVTTDRRLFPGWWALAPVIGAWLLIFAGPDAWVNRKLLSNRLMIWVGLISYPLYLWHWPLLSFTRIMSASNESAPALRGAAVGLSLVLAWLTYRLLERPIRYGCKTWVKTAGLVFVLTTVGGVGYACLANDGFIVRTKDSIFDNVPGLAENARQFGWEYNATPECWGRYPEFQKGHFCEVSDLQKPSILLISDSFANQLFPGLSTALAKSGESIVNFGDSACPPFIGVEVMGRSQRDQNVCVEIIGKILNFSKETASIHTVIMAGNWRTREQF